MKNFEAAMRVAFEDNAKGFYPSVLQKLKGIEIRAKKAKEEGKNPRIELEQEVEELEADISFTTQVRAQQLEDKVNEVKQEYRRKEEKNPNLKLMKMQEAQLKINSMDDNELKDYTNRIAQEAENITAEEASVALSRLKGPERGIIKERVEMDYLDRPWLQDPEVQEVYKESQMLNNTPPGNVLADGMAIHIEHLIDFDDELNAEV